MIEKKIEKKAFTINADLGEQGIESETDHHLMPLIDIANIACGGHAGDANTVAYYQQLAVEYDVTTCAHIGYADRNHFGRQEKQLTTQQLLGEIEPQRSLMPDTDVLKLHGALYNQSCVEFQLAETLADWVCAVGFRQVLTLPFSCFAQALARRGIKVLHEAFVERRYCLLDNGLVALMPRRVHGACIDTVVEAESQMRFLLNGEVEAYLDETLQASKRVSIPIDSVCVHSDSPIACSLVDRVRRSIDLDRKGKQ